MCRIHSGLSQVQTNPQPFQTGQILTVTAPGMAVPMRGNDVPEYELHISDRVVVPGNPNVQWGKYIVVATLDWPTILFRVDIACFLGAAPHTVRFWGRPIPCRLFITVPNVVSMPTPHLHRTHRTHTGGRCRWNNRGNRRSHCYSRFQCRRAGLP
jgi:hypothetical protein